MQVQSDRPIAAFVFGFGFMRAWALTLLSTSGVVMPLSMLTEGTLRVFAPVFIGTLALTTWLTMHKKVDLLSYKSLVAMAATAMAGSLLLCVGEPSTLYVGDALAGASFGLFLMQWGVASSNVSHKRLVSSLVIGFVWAGALCLLGAFLPSALRIALFVAYAPASAACLRELSVGTPGAESRRVEFSSLGSGAIARARWTSGGGRELLVRLVVAMFTIELVARSALMLSGEYCTRTLGFPSWSFEMARLLGTVVASAVFYGFVRRAKAPLLTLNSLVPVTLVCSCLFLHFGGMGMPWVTYSIAFTAGAWLETVYWVFFSHSCTAVGKPPVLVWAAGRAAFWASTFVGIGLWSAQAQVWEGGIVSDNAALTTLVVLMALGIVLVHTLILPTEKIAQISIMRDRELERKAAFRDIEATATAIAERGGLSPREREIFLMLAHGRDTAYIQEKLFISQGTVRSHRDRIYRKLGIHSKQELLDLVEREFTSGAAEDRQPAPRP